MDAISCKHRLCSLQQLCSSDPASPLPQALLFIGGIDGQNNVGCRRAFSYLFGGSSGYDIHNQFLSTFDEVVLVISRDACFLYCDGKAFHEIVSIIGHWDGLKVSRLPEGLPDTDAAEEFKILKFLEMVDGFDSFGVPLTTRMEKVDPMELEKWPLVQSFAIQGLASEGFFTMVKRIFDISEKLEEIYSRVDRVGLVHLSREIIPHFRQQWESVLRIVEETPPKNRSHIKLEDLLEPLETFFDYGNLRESGKSGKPRPEVSRHPHHLSISAQDPRWPVACSRSFLSSNCGAAESLGARYVDDPDFEPAAEISARAGEEGDESVSLDFQQSSHEFEKMARKKLIENHVTHPARKTAQLISAVISTHTLTISKISEIFSGKKKIDFSNLKASLYEFVSEQLKSFSASLDLKLEILDMFARPTERHTSPTQNLYFLEIIADGVRYGDTFALQIDFKNNMRGVCVTEGVEKFVGWAEGGREGDDAEGDEWRETISVTIMRLEASPKHTYPNIGSLLSQEAITNVEIKDGSLLRINSDLYFTDSAIIFHDHLLGWGVIHVQKFVQKIIMWETQYPPNTPSAHLRFSLSLSPEFIFFGISSLSPRSPPSLSFSITAAKASTRFLEHNVFQIWREKFTEIEFAIGEGPEELLDNSLSENGHINDAEILISNFQISPPRVPTPKETHIPVTLVFGAPCSLSERILKTCVSLASQPVVILPISNSNFKVERDFVNKKISTLPQDLKEARVILVAETYQSSVEICEIVGEVLEKFNLSLGTVTAIINSIEIFRGRGWPDASVCAQCVSGWTNIIIFTNTHILKGNLERLVKNEISKINPTAVFMFPHGSLVTTGTDINILLGLSENTSKIFIGPEAFLRRKLITFRVPLSSVTTHTLSLPPSSLLDLDRLKNIFKSRLSLAIQNETLEEYIGRRGRRETAKRLFSVEGKLRVKDGENISCVKIEAVGESFSISPLSPPPENFYFSFSGENISKFEIADAILAARPAAHAPAEKKTEKDLTKEELEKIRQENLSVPLPDGIFFDGSRFVDFSGERQHFHPDMPIFIEAYLAKFNETSSGDKTPDAFSAAEDEAEFKRLNGL